MKKPYAESTLKRKYRETGIPKEVLEKLHLYFVACAHFYKIISVDEVWKVIKRTEARQGKKELEEILNPSIIHMIHMMADSLCIICHLFIPVFVQAYVPIGQD